MTLDAPQTPGCSDRARTRHLLCAAATPRTGRTARRAAHPPCAPPRQPHRSRAAAWGHAPSRRGAGTRLRARRSDDWPSQCRAQRTHQSPRRRPRATTTNLVRPQRVLDVHGLAARDPRAQPRDLARRERVRDVEPAREHLMMTMASVMMNYEFVADIRINSPAPHCASSRAHLGRRRVGRGARARRGVAHAAPAERADRGHELLAPPELGHAQPPLEISLAMRGGGHRTREGWRW